MSISLRRDYEKWLLLATGTGALIVSCTLIIHSFAVGTEPKQVEGSVLGHESSAFDGPIGSSQVRNERDRLKTGLQWTPPVGKDGAPHRLFVSPPVIVNSLIYDWGRDLSEPMWPPVPNHWWIKNRLDWTDPLCRESDPRWRWLEQSG